MVVSVCFAGPADGRAAAAGPACALSVVWTSEGGAGQLAPDHGEYSGWALLVAGAGSKVLTRGLRGSVQL